MVVKVVFSCQERLHVDCFFLLSFKVHLDLFLYASLSQSAYMPFFNIGSHFLYFILFISKSGLLQCEAALL